MQKHATLSLPVAYIPMAKARGFTLYMVKKCEQLVQEGSFFHCIEPGDAAKKAMEEDRDEFFKDFISLTYEYSAEEIQAAKGYIRYDLHADHIRVAS